MHCNYFRDSFMLYSSIFLFNLKQINSLSFYLKLSNRVCIILLFKELNSMLKLYDVEDIVQVITA
jgi:hypothetical protein